MPFGGGIDSIVTVERVRRRADVALFVVSRPADRFDAIEQPAAVTGLPVVRAEREIDPQLLRSAELGFLNGHVPVTGILSAIAVLAAVLEDRDAVVMSNEWSASVPTLEYRGRPVNHQFSKSEQFEAAFRDVLANCPAPLPGYFSWLRDRTELWVGQEFAALEPYHGSFRSCNKAFYTERARRLDHWCGQCDKCCFIDLILAPFLPRRGAAADLRGHRGAARGSGAGRQVPLAARRGRQAVRVRRRGHRVPRRGAAGRTPGRPGGDKPAARTRGRGGRLAGRAVRRGRRRHAPARGSELHPSGVSVTAPKLSWSDLAGARVGVWGLGREGHANLRKLLALGVEPVLVDDQPPAAPVDGRPVLATGDGGLAALQRCDVVVKTPGLSRYRPEVARLTELGIPVVGGLGLWLAEADLRRVLVVTGTKGKSTTSSVTGHLLAGLGYRCMLGGNIGAPPYDPARDGDVDYWVIEVSSYQATDLPCSPPVVAVTSLHPDHLDWHGGVEQYYRDKLSACSQPGAELTVANGDSDLLRERAGLLGPRVEWVREDDEPGADWMEPLGLPGRHNRRNALIARRCLVALGVPGAGDDARLRAAAAGYQPLPSRLAPVGTVGGVTFVDDSLSTNVLPTLAALDAFPGRRIALIVGGQDRGIDYAPLAAGVLARRAPTYVLTLPDSGPRIRAQIETAQFETAQIEAGGFAGVTDCRDLDDAVAAGFGWARPDGVVLLSPAAPSFGRFRDYRDRGDAFARAVRALS